MFWFFWNRLLTPSILQRVGIRQLPGICWYPAKCIGAFLWIKAAPRIVSYSLYLYVIRPWQIAIFCQGRFLFSKSLAQNKNQWSFPVLRGGEYKVMTMKNENIPYKIYLNESEMPKAWYNLRADMKQRPEPVNRVLPFPWLVPTLTLTVKYIW